MPRRNNFRTFIIVSLGLIFLILTFVSASLSYRSKKAYSHQQLFRLGKQRIFKGPHLNEIAFPLGGIGTGTVSLGGRGNLRDWEIFNRPGKGINLPFTFFALYFKQEEKSPLVRILEGPIASPFREDFGHGYNRAFVPGLPRMEKAFFRAKYPYAQVELMDSQLPLSIFLEVLNPLIPLKPEESGIPAFIIRYRIKNISSKPAKVTVVGSIMNPIGFNGLRQLRDISGKEFGQNVNELRRTDHLSGILFSSKKVEPDSPTFGTMALTSPWKKITYLTHWKRGRLAEGRQSFWDDFKEDGRLKDLEEVSPSPEGRTDMGSFGLIATLGPFEEIVIPFVIAWHFPNLTNYMEDKWFDRFKEERGKVYKTHYSTRFKNAWEVAEHLVRNLPELEEKTQRFIKIFFSSTLPPYVLEAISSQASIIRTPTCFWLEDGSFFGFEGCNETFGSCPLNCTHVWNYAQSLAFLFPSLERSMRKTDFLNNVKPNGDMAFRTTLPLGEGRYWNHAPAADGQMGRIISLYRDWQISGDMDFLREIWPQAKKALEYAWISWDKDKDGIMEGVQHNTYDIEFYGPNSMISSIYLGALLAGSRMADAMRDREAAQAYKEIFEKGRKKFDELLWNGEYFIQRYDRVMEEKYQYGKGCLSDQLIGQWISMVAGLGRFLPEERIKTSLQSIFRNNFLTDFRTHYNMQRIFALGDEKGLLVCSWPKGGRSYIPVRYCDEVWTGIEYQVASHMIYEGLIEEGLSIVKAIRERYDGRKRNPWNEEECGNHYARAMASWGVLLALSGYSYSGPEMRIGFNPKVHHENFRCFWSTGSGWGRFSQKIDNGKKEKIELLVALGRLKLKQFTFHLPPGLRDKKIESLQVRSGNKSLKTDFIQEDNRINVRWKKPCVLKTGDRIEIETLF